ncbi:lipoate--protein ligase family protein [Bacillus sp. FSL W7-1360]
MAFIQSARWRLLAHHTHNTNSALTSFAADDTLCTLAGRHGQYALRFWVHDNTIVLGTQDTRLPHIEAGLSFLEQKNYRVVVRNSGGLAVHLDKGIFNLSLIFPGDVTASIDDGYEYMVSLIRRMFPEAIIATGEVNGSYCPGSYDLSINGKKFAGISQRRMRGGIAVQIYLCVTGSGQARGEVIRDFYMRAGGSTSAAPCIQPAVMASLNELLNTSYTVTDIAHRAKVAFTDMGVTLTSIPFTHEEQSLYEMHVQRVTERHQRCLQP